MGRTSLAIGVNSVYSCANRVLICSPGKQGVVSYMRKCTRSFIKRAEFSCQTVLKRFLLPRVLLFNFRENSRAFSFTTRKSVTLPLSLQLSCIDNQVSKMSDQAPIVKATTPTKTKKSPAKSTAKSPKVGSAKKNASKTNSKGKSIAEHPTYVDMAMQAIKVLKERSGSSRQAVLKYIMSNYQVGSNAKQVNNQLKAALHRGVTKGKIPESRR